MHFYERFSVAPICVLRALLGCTHMVVRALAYVHMHVCARAGAQAPLHLLRPTAHQPQHIAYVHMHVCARAGAQAPLHFLRPTAHQPQQLAAGQGAGSGLRSGLGIPTIRLPVEVGPVGLGGENFWGVEHSEVAVAPGSPKEPGKNRRGAWGYFCGVEGRGC